MIIINLSFVFTLLTMGLNSIRTSHYTNTAQPLAEAILTPVGVCARLPDQAPVCELAFGLARKE